MSSVVHAYLEPTWLVRLLFQRGLAAIYLVAFVSASNQFRPLLGERGLLPVTRFLARVPFRRAPSLFYIHYSDRLFRLAAWIGIALSAAALTGISEAGPVLLSSAVWLVLWTLYLSIVNVGQTFYAFGWESMLLEAGFFAIFLGPAHREPSMLPIMALRWMLFRTELGAGLIKLRHDRCWRDLTCLYYHHETQPLPNPMSWYFHRIPKPLLRGGVVFSHFVQLVAPFGLLMPNPVCAIAGVLIIVHQLLLITAGNYSWLNWLTVILGVTALSDPLLLAIVPVHAPTLAPRSSLNQVVVDTMGLVTLALSVKPALNFFSRDQVMNYNYNPLHLVNAYGAFGSMSRERLEIVVEGAADDDGTEWKEYTFKAKPGDPKRRPPQVAPYHLRLDWLMWFLPLGGFPETWFLRFVEKLLEGDREVLALLHGNPFPDGPPRWVRARMYEYRFTDPRERNATGAWWTREDVGEFLRPVSLADMP